VSLAPLGAVLYFRCHLIGTTTVKKISPCPSYVTSIITETKNLPSQKGLLILKFVGFVGIAFVGILQYQATKKGMIIEDRQGIRP
jgi:hypothetical protein